MHGGSIINAVVPTTTIQLIFTAHHTPEKLVRGFDLTHLASFYSGGKLMVHATALESHLSRVSRFTGAHVRRDRVYKAQARGFKVEYSGGLLEQLDASKLKLHTNAAVAIVTDVDLESCTPLPTTLDGYIHITADVVTGDVEQSILDLVVLREKLRVNGPTAMPTIKCTTSNSGELYFTPFFRIGTTAMPLCDALRATYEELAAALDATCKGRVISDPFTEANYGTFLKSEQVHRERVGNSTKGVVSFKFSWVDLSVCGPSIVREVQAAYPHLHGARVFCAKASSVHIC